MGLAKIEDAIAAIGRGEIVVVLDDEDRENEGDLIMAAEHVTPEKIAFFLRYTSGYICATLTGERCDELDLPLMVTANTESMRTAFTVTVDYRHGTTTGISAFDRAATILSLVRPDTRPGDLARPGHICPLRAAQGGVLKRAGHTEAAVDLARMAGCFPAGILCEITDEKKLGMARFKELETFAKEHDLLMITIADMIRYRRRTEKLVDRFGEATIPTDFGSWQCIVFRNLLDNNEHLAFVYGEVAGADDVLVRVHSECLTGDVFRSKRCDCGPQLDEAMRRIRDAGRGVVVYLRGHEGRGIGIGHKIRAYSLQDQGRDTVDANTDQGLPVDSREYGIGAQILVDLGVTTMKLMTNNPSKYGGLEGFGLEITGRESIEIEPNEHNAAYLATKRERMGHMLSQTEN